MVPSDYVNVVILCLPDHFLAKCRDRKFYVRFVSHSIKTNTITKVQWTIGPLDKV